MQEESETWREERAVSLRGRTKMPVLPVPMLVGSNVKAQMPAGREDVDYDHSPGCP